MTVTCTRTNQASRADVSRDVFASGTFKLVYKGTYTDGINRGKACVAKEFKTGAVDEESYFKEELDVCAATATIINTFNEGGYINRSIYLNILTVWTFLCGMKIGQKHLLEPMIDHFEKFNSNSGWVSETRQAWGEAMQALSHFSYDFSNGG